MLLIVALVMRAHAEAVLPDMHARRGCRLWYLFCKHAYCGCMLYRPRVYCRLQDVQYLCAHAVDTLNAQVSKHQLDFQGVFDKFRLSSQPTVCEEPAT